MTFVCSFCTQKWWKM